MAPRAGPTVSTWSDAPERRTGRGWGQRGGVPQVRVRDEQDGWATLTRRSSCTLSDRRNRRSTATRSGCGKKGLPLVLCKRGRLALLALLAFAYDAVDSGGLRERGEIYAKPPVGPCDLGLCYFIFGVGAGLGPGTALQGSVWAERHSNRRRGGHPGAARLVVSHSNGHPGRSLWRAHRLQHPAGLRHPPHGGYCLDPFLCRPAGRRLLPWDRRLQLRRRRLLHQQMVPAREAGHGTRPLRHGYDRTVDRGLLRAAPGHLLPYLDHRLLDLRPRQPDLGRGLLESGSQCVGSAAGLARPHRPGLPTPAPVLGAVLLLLHHLR